MEDDIKATFMLPPDILELLTGNVVCDTWITCNWWTNHFFLFYLHCELVLVIWPTKLYSRVDWKFIYLWCTARESKIELSEQQFVSFYLEGNESSVARAFMLEMSCSARATFHTLTFNIGLDLFQVLFGATALTVHETYEKVVNFTYPISVQSYGMMIPRPKELSRLYLFIAPFTLDVRFIEIFSPNFICSSFCFLVDEFIQSLHTIWNNFSISSWYRLGFV